MVSVLTLPSPLCRRISASRWPGDGKLEMGQLFFSSMSPLFLVSSAICSPYLSEPLQVLGNRSSSHSLRHDFPSAAPLTSTIVVARSMLLHRPRSITLVSVPTSFSDAIACGSKKDLSRFARLRVPLEPHNKVAFWPASPIRDYRLGRHVITVPFWTEYNRSLLSC